MNYLLDTHSFLWALFEPDRLSLGTRRILESREHEIYLSGVSLWEIALKFSLGKLTLAGITPADLPAAAREVGIVTLLLTIEDAATSHMLPRGLHKDPFDRMLAWQAIRRGWPLISADGRLTAYAAHGLLLLR